MPEDKMPPTCVCGAYHCPNCQNPMDGLSCVSCGKGWTSESFLEARAENAEIAKSINFYDLFEE